MNEQAIKNLENDWSENHRWQGIERPYTAADVVRLRGSLPITYSLASHGAEKLWKYMQEEDWVNALGAVTGNQAMQQVRAGLKAIYCSGWQVAADANEAGEMYPDQSLYPADAVPTRSTMPRATNRSTGFSRSWPTPKRASAACSTPSS